jgi:hypothetical protein
LRHAEHGIRDGNFLLSKVHSCPPYGFTRKSAPGSPMRGNPTKVRRFERGL